MGINNNFMETVFEIIFGRFIVRFLGIRTRYLILSMFNKKLTIDQLKGEDKGNQSYQDFYNAVIGLMIFCFLSIVIAYFFFTYFE